MTAIRTNSNNDPSPAESRSFFRKRLAVKSGADARNRGNRTSAVRKGNGRTNPCFPENREPQNSGRPAGCLPAYALCPPFLRRRRSFRSTVP
ncbi:hypothetical protein B4135_1994 [Caldibacillus debilis]|uniref:Uncharacterized protein n=1 Tax=Caldibacillus debilis TaxID=301148 RepID=A0A150M6R3_9BACI|nr:hypothetical protein B4135_1994 [Caldibacillus debilis]